MKKSKSWKKAARFWGEYWVEIMAVLAVIVGVGLIRFETSKMYAGIDALKNVFHSVVNFLLRFSTYDLIGIVVVVGGIVVVLWRVRFHLLKSDRWRVRECPLCGSPVHRIHRTTLDRLVSFLILPHGRRFGCDNPDCHWTGLRYGRHHTNATEADFPVTTTQHS